MPAGVKDRRGATDTAVHTPDNERLSLFPELRCTATPSLTPTETQPYFAAGTGITPFRAISNLPTSPTGTSTAAFRAGSHSA